MSRSIEVLVVLGCIAIIALLIAPIFSTRPSDADVRHGEANYSAVLPPGYSDFRAHWKDQDIGVHIFSFRCPQGEPCDQVLSGLIRRLNTYRVQEQTPGEVALRRSVVYYDPRGFDEFRFLCVPADRRVYAMFANLDSEMNAHPRLVERLHKIARNEAE